MEQQQSRHNIFANCLFVYLFASLFLFFFFLLISLPTGYAFLYLLDPYPYCLSICLSVYQSVCFSVTPFCLFYINLSVSFCCICLSAFFLFLCLSVFQFFTFVSLSVSFCYSRLPVFVYTFLLFINFFFLFTLSMPRTLFFSFSALMGQFDYV